MEAMRPLVDAHVLGVLSGPLRKREFTEDARGVVRCLAPITHRLAEAMPSYAIALGPVVETVAGILAKASPYDVTVPSILSGAKHKAAARRRVDAESKATTAHPAAGVVTNSGAMRPPRRRRTKPPASPPLPLRIVSWVRRSVAGRERQGHGPDRMVPELSGRAPGGGRFLPPRSGTSLRQTLRRADRGAPDTYPGGKGVTVSFDAGATNAQSAYRATDHAAIDPEWYGATVQPLWRASPCRPSPRLRASRLRPLRSGVPVEQPARPALGCAGGTGGVPHPLGVCRHPAYWATWWPMLLGTSRRPACQDNGLNYTARRTHRGT